MHHHIYIYHTNPWRIVDTKKTNNTVMYIITLGEIFVTSKYLKKKKKNTYTKKIPIKKKKKVSIDYFIPSASIYDLDPAGKCKNEPRIPEKTREREEGEEEFQDGTGEKWQTEWKNERDRDGTGRDAACASVMRFQTNGAAVSGIVTRKERVHLRAIAEFTFYSANLPPSSPHRDSQERWQLSSRMFPPPSPYCTPRERRGGKKNTAWTKIRRKSPFSTWAFLARGAGGEGGSGEGVNACITLRIELFSSWRRWPNDRTGGKILLARGNVATRAVNPTSLPSCEVLFVNRER